MSQRAWQALPAGWHGPGADCLDCVALNWASLDASGAAALHTAVTPGDIADAARYRRDNDRQRSLAGRALARHCLARMTGADPRAITVLRSASGKPFVAGGPQFNLSHAGDFAVLALTRTAHCGIDIEARPAAAGWREVVRLLHPTERDHILTSPDPETIFLDLWTRKEAVAKADGCGLLVDPASWSVLAGPPWRVQPFSPGRGHTGSLAAERDLRVQFWLWHPAPR